MTEQPTKHNTLEFETFFNRYRQKTEELDIQKIKEYEDGFGSFLRSYKANRKEVMEELKFIADDYNVFDLLGVKTKETVTHSPIIANLLNTRGSHAQGTLFYRRFVEVVYSDGVLEKLLNIDEDALDVNMEYSTPDGFIDVFIQHKNSNNPFCIIIENKIYATDQYKQLKRYYDFAINVLRMNASDVFIIYLKDGSDASEYSMSIQLQNELKSKQQLVNVSYSGHITVFLKSVLNKISANPVKEIVKQYLTTVQNLGL